MTAADREVRYGVRSWLVLVAACATAPASAPPLENRKPASALRAEQALRIEVSHHGCDSCPTFLVVLHGDGTVEWRGDAGVTVEGRRTGTADPRAVGHVRTALELTEFFKRGADGYLPRDGAAADCPGFDLIVIEVRDGARHNRVEMPNCDTPREMLDLSEQIEDAAGVSAWR